MAATKKMFRVYLKPRRDQCVPEIVFVTAVSCFISARGDLCFTNASTSYAMTAIVSSFCVGSWVRIETAEPATTTEDKCPATKST